MPKYKLLIIDDEPIIRQGLRTIIDWEYYQIEICGEADNGIDGLRLCRELKPDVIIVDIKMPGMNGLEIIEAAKQAGIESDFIVLSGYSEFAFAQKTTEYGVRCYLLKPIEQRELIRVIETLRKEWDTRFKERERVKQSLHLKAEYELQQMLQSIAMDDEELLVRYELLSAHLSLPWEAYQVVLISDEHRELEADEVIWILNRLQASCMYGGDRRTVFAFRQYVGILTEASDVLAPLKKGLSDAEERFDLRLVAAVGNRATRLHHLPESFQNALAVMRDKFFGGREEGVIAQGDYLRQEAPQASDSVNLEHSSNEAAQAIASGNTGGLACIVMDMEQAMLHCGWDEQQIKAGFVALYREIIKILSRIDEQLKALWPPFPETVQGVESQTSLRALHDYMEQQLLCTAALWAKGRRSGGFQSILDYISEHSGSDLKLEVLADIFHYNSSYLGKLFKSQTGETFNSHLDRIRMEKAKQLLAGGSKVYEVASLVGYASVDYFHLKFKKMIGQSPSAYRERWTL